MRILTKSQAKKLSKDWSAPKIVKNDKGKKVFRFKINSPAKGPDGKIHQAIATVDISESETKEVVPNGHRSAS